MAAFSRKIQGMDPLQARVDDFQRKLAALFDVMELSSGFGDLRQALTRSLRRVLTATDGHAGLIHLLGRQRRHLHLLCSQGVPDEALPHYRRIVMPGHPLFQPVWSSRRPITIVPMQADPRTADLVDPAGRSLYMAVPIAVGDQVWGVLSYITHAPDSFTQYDADMLQSFGEQIGLTVENARLRRQAQQLALERERNQLVRELHDSVTQSLYSAALFAEAGRRMAAAGELDQAQNYLQEVALTTQQALKEMRLLVYKLRPRLLEKDGLVGAIRHRLRAVEERTGVQTHFTADDVPRYSAQLEDAAFYVALEALNNALKHAAANTVWVTLTPTENGIQLIVRDNGVGFDRSAADGSGGAGLPGMAERAEAQGGAVQFDTAPGAGTTVTAVLYESTAIESEEDDDATLF